MAEKIQISIVLDLPHPADKATSHNVAAGIKGLLEKVSGGKAQNIHVLVSNVVSLD